jgi:hypothetical protein
MRPVIGRYLVRILSETTYIVTERFRGLSQSVQVNVGKNGLRPLPFESFECYNSTIFIQREPI